MGTSFSAAALEPDQMTATTLTGARHMSVRAPVKAVGSALLADAIRKASVGAPVPGIDSLANFTGGYTANGFDAKGKWNTTWTYAMIGNPPSGNHPISNSYSGWDYISLDISIASPILRRSTRQ